MVYVWLNKVDNLWYATEVNNPQLLDLFGTDTLPLPFGQATPLETVLATLQTKNPERTFHYSKTIPRVKNLFDPMRYGSKNDLREVCVLHSIKDGGLFVFDLNKKAQQLVKDSFTPGSLEPVLKKLLLEKHVTRVQKQVPSTGSLVWFYEITPRGMQHLKDKVEQL
jgi:Transcriptional regulator PadR-like family